MGTRVWISGASAGIGAALAASVPFTDATVVDISRSGARGTTHLRADLADPSAWPGIGVHFADALASDRPDHAVFVHSAGVIEPIGVAGTTDPGAYTRNVLLNSAAPQVLGSAFLAAVAAAGTPRATLVLVSSGAAHTSYAGWSAYCAGKAAVDHWVRTVGVEQAALPRPVQVLAVAPGSVETGMQSVIRGTSPADFPQVDSFIARHRDGEVRSPEWAAAGIWALVARDDLPPGSVVDLRRIESEG